MLKKIIVPLIVLIILIILALVLKGPSTYKSGEPGEAITNFAPGEAMRIELSQGGKQISLLRNEGKWLAASSFNYPVKEAKVQELLDKTKNLKRSDAVSKNPEKHSLFQVDAAQGKLLKILDKSNNTLADIYIGKNGTDYQSTYIRPHNADEVLTVDENISRLIAVDDKTWLELSLVKCEQKDIAKITLKSHADNSAITLKQAESGDWSVIAPKTFPCDKNAANEITQVISNLELESVAPVTALAAYGLEPPQRMVIVQKKDNSAETLLVGSPAPSGDYYAKLLSSNFSVIVRKAIIEKLAKRLEDFIDKTLAKFETANVTELTIKYLDTELVISKTETGNWILLEPVQSEPITAQNDTVNFIINTFSNLRANVATAETDLSATGLVSPQFQITGALKDGTKQTLLIGNKKDDQAYYVKKSDSETIYLLSKHYAENLMKKPEDFKAKPPEPPKDDQPKPPEENK